ncbi:MAG TPA: nuclear transport factor 2 family protein [Thermomicrobiales bacterium]
MRKPILPLTLLLTLLTGLALANFRLVLLEGGSAGSGVAFAPTASSTLTSTIERFYVAVNGALTSGSQEEVEAFLAPDFLDHDPVPGSAPDRAGFLATLEALHAAGPAIDLRVEEVVADGDRVAVRLRVRADQSQSALLQCSGAPWPATEVFRLASGRIVERWADSGGRGVITPVLAVNLPPSVGELTDITLTRKTVGHIPAVNRDVLFGSTGPTIVFVEDGALSITMDRRSDPAVVRRIGGGAETLAPEKETVIKSGESLILPAGSHYRVSSAGPNPAHILTIALYPVISAHQTAVASNRGPAEPYGTPVTAVTEFQMLAMALSVRLPDPMTIRLVRVALSPGLQILPHPVSRAELLSLTTGELLSDLRNDAGYVYSQDHEGNGLVENPSLIAGQGLYVDAGSTVEYTAIGSEPATFWLVVITPGVAAKALVMPTQTAQPEFKRDMWQ